MGKSSEIAKGGGRVIRHMKKQCLVNYYDIISADNLLSAWREFIVGKKLKPDVQQFSLNLIDNILQLHDVLANHTYHHGGYKSFYITDPKLRHIHKASVRDRLVCHAIYRQLYPFFAKTFIADSHSCQLGKGTHKAVARFKHFSRQVSKNNTVSCWVLKCDIKKFFESIDHAVILRILDEYITDKEVIKLLTTIIKSFSVHPAKGLPLGNLTSQLFVNVYMNELDQFIKHNIKEKYYIRYADDFVVLSNDRNSLLKVLCCIQEFLRDELKVALHPDKVFIKTIASGVDFLGWVSFPYYSVLRTKTKRRMMCRIKKVPQPQRLAAYVGLLRYGDTFKVK